MVDRSSGEVPLVSAWRSLGRRVSVAGGSFVALVSLFHHVPASTAALRGGGTWIALLLATRLGCFALGHAHRQDAVEEERGEETGAGPNQ